MKTNYLKLKKTLIIAICIGSFAGQAQTTVVNATTDLIVAPGTYTPAFGVVTFQTAELAHDGTTFNLQITVTPDDSEDIVADANGWGIADLTTADVRATFDEPTNDAAAIGSITVVNFNPGTTSYTTSSISNLNFESIEIYGGQATADRTAIGVNGGALTDIGRLTDLNQIIPFTTEFTSRGTSTWTLSTVDVTSFNLTNGENADNASNRISIASIKIAYRFTEDTSLSIDDIVKKDTLTIYPTVVENIFSVNKPFDTLQLFDITGKKVKTFSASDTLEVSGLVSGLYIVKIQSEIGVATGRLVVKK